MSRPTSTSRPFASSRSRADSVARGIFIGANRTFNAPIDREDILRLAHVLDDVVDLIEDTAKGIQRYAISIFAQEMRAMVDAVVESAELLQQVMPFLDSITRDHKDDLRAVRGDRAASRGVPTSRSTRADAHARRARRAS